MTFGKHLQIVAAVPVITVAACFTYDPFGVKSLCDFGSFVPQTHLVLLGCIFVLTLALSRLVYALFDRHRPIGLKTEVIWCVAETVVASLLMGIYIGLFSGMPYFSCVAGAFQVTAPVAVLPYVVIFQMNHKEHNPSGPASPVSDSLVRFLDENQRLRLAVSPSSVLYVNAENNSVRIHYLDADRVKDLQIRISMTKLAPTADKCRLVRCQRSYYVNPDRVRALRKDKDGFIYAELGVPGVPDIPVSKPYYDNLSSLL